MSGSEGAIAWFRWARALTASTLMNASVSGPVKGHLLSDRAGLEECRGGASVSYASLAHEVDDPQQVVGQHDGSHEDVEVNPDGTAFEVLHAFICVSDGCFPRAGLTAGSDGKFYGTSLNGGAAGRGHGLPIEPGRHGVRGAPRVHLWERRVRSLRGPDGGQRREVLRHDPTWRRLGKGGRSSP